MTQNSEHYHEKGIPRGIGVSAYLSELYMREFDDAVLKLSEVTFYARYVDDIIIIISPKPNSNYENLLTKIKSQLKSIELEINEEKSDTINLLIPSNKSFEYLGYKFSFGTSKTKIELSKKRKEKYIRRIELSFSNYIKKRKFNEKTTRKDLIKRISFLTGNTKLLNNKNNALIGIYFSNPFLNDDKCLEYLDKKLSSEIQKLDLESLKDRLDRFSFRAGFHNRIFYNFTTTQLSRIVRIWKYVD